MYDTETITPRTITDTHTDSHARGGKAYEFASHAAALAVQDAVDNLRNINSICTAALGAVLAQAVEAPATAEQCSAIAKTIQDIQAAANANFSATNESIARMINEFPRSN